MKTYVVYDHISPSGKHYVGQTCQKVEARWGKDGVKYLRNHQPAFSNAIIKYGWDAFEHKILFEGLSKQDADMIEIDLIYYYQKEGLSYNIAKGGEGNLKYDDGSTYRSRNRERIRSKDKEYKELHKEDILQKSKEYRDAHKEYYRQKARERRETNKEEIRTYQKAYREAHREELNARSREWACKHRDELKDKQREQSRKYREAHREELNAKQRERRRLKKQHNESIKF